MNNTSIELRARHQLFMHSRRNMALFSWLFSAIRSALHDPGSTPHLSGGELQVSDVYLSGAILAAVQSIACPSVALLLWNQEPSLSKIGTKHAHK